MNADEPEELIPISFCLPDFGDIDSCLVLLALIGVLFGHVASFGGRGVQDLPAFFAFVDFLYLRRLLLERNEIEQVERSSDEVALTQLPVVKELDGGGSGMELHPPDLLRVAVEVANRLDGRETAGGDSGLRPLLEIPPGLIVKDRREPDRAGQVPQRMDIRAPEPRAAKIVDIKSGKPDGVRLSRRRAQADPGSEQRVLLSDRCVGGVIEEGKRVQRRDGVASARNH